MYIRPLVNVHHLYVTVTMSYVQRKKLTVSYIFALCWEKAIQKYSTLLYKKNHATFIKMEEALVSVITKLFQSISYYAYYPDLKFEQIDFPKCPY